jgi:AraC-like DNA-binding protein
MLLDKERKISAVSWHSMLLSREPCAALRPFVKTLWTVDQAASPWCGVTQWERVLPTGDMHIAIRLCDPPIRLLKHSGDSAGGPLGHAVIGGPRATFYTRDISQPISTVGAQIHSIAARGLFGMPACEFADRHTRLDDVWSAWVEGLREQLIEATNLAQRLDILERVLVSRLRAVRRLHPAVAHGLQALHAGLKVREVVEETGYSHRRFIALFREETGLAPKRFCRVLRFQKMLQEYSLNPAVSWSDLAHDCGYSDQAHFNREFREFAGVTPEEYRSCSQHSAARIPLLR